MTQGRLAGWIAGQGRLSKVAGERFTVPSGVDHFICNGPWARRARRWRRVRAGNSTGCSRRRSSVSHGRLGLAGELARLMRDQRVMVSFVPDAVQERLLSSRQLGGASRASGLTAGP